MVFSSIQSYLDPSNWQQHNPHSVACSENLQLPLPPPPPPLGGGGGSIGSGSGSAASIRPGSMAERARLAKIPQPEAALKCPRCDSTNTKFCYFNNYSLSQPRHFCKTCRRYWTRGGALRNVPVGGGSRRNKRSKGSNNRSKSPSKASSSTSSGLVTNSCTADTIRHQNMVHPPQQLPILPPLHHLNDYNSTDIGLNFGGIQPHVAATTASVVGGGMEFQMGNTSGGGGGSLSSEILDQWRLQQVQQFPFLGNLEAPNGLYSFENEGVEAANYVGQIRSKPLDSGVISQLADVKMEENQQNQLNLSKNLLGISGNYQYWPIANAWSNNDLPGFTSSSTTHPL